MNKPRTKNETHSQPELLEVQEHEQSPEFQEAIERDFGSAVHDTGDGFSRRRWLQLMGASLALGGVAGCRYQEEKIASFAFRPHNRIPGVPQQFATLTELGGVAEPLISTSYDGRPIKLDGNPIHPETKGGSSVFSQARILEFYDPDRLREPLKSDGDTFTETTFEEFVNACRFGSDVSKTAVLSEPTSSLSMAGLKDEFTTRGGKWFEFAAINDDNARAGAKLAFGDSVRPVYDLNCETILAIDCDPLSMAPGSVANSIHFAQGRDADSGHMSRLYVVESQYSTTGSAADHRLSVRSGDIPGFVASLAAAIDNPVEPTKEMAYRQRVFAAMVSDLTKSKGKSVVMVGESQSPEVHALVHKINEKLENFGKTVTLNKVDERPSSIESIRAFAEGLKNGAITRVVILGGNPVFDAPRELGLAELISGAQNSAHISFYKNETSLACDWISAVAHPLACWKDGTTVRGSILIGQPLINPLFGGKSDLETIATLAGNDETDGLAIIQKTLPPLDRKQWAEAVHAGFIADTAAETFTPSSVNAPEVAASDAWATEWDGSTFELVFKPSNSLYDGRFANNAWLQELPDFFTKITWDNVAQISPATAKELGVTQRGMGAKSKTQMITINVGGEPVRVPIAIQPGQADGSIGLAIGYGRTAAGRVGGNRSLDVDAIGHDITSLRSADQWNLRSIDGSSINSTGTTYQLALVQEPWAIDEVAREEIQARMFRDPNKNETDRSALIREGTLRSYNNFLGEHPDVFEAHGHDQGNAAKSESKTKTAYYSTGPNGELPVMTPVSYTPPVTDDEEESHDHHDHVQWPEAFHMHHSLFDLTPGTREDYKADNPAHTNVWGMSIDLNKCIGCNSCVIACQSENNIPVVGKAEVWRGREMHWMRIDRYYGNNLYTDDAKGDDIQMVHQPVTCQHCENAPCENVCPVAATVHSSEGLNDMVYNRCIGTRYCGNNCPYKVRRFNYLNYTDAVTFIKYPGADKLPAGDLQLQSLMVNPEVSVRSRGVMEKCTFCVQRIQNTKIQAKNEGRRPIGPNEIETACQVACPTSAIKFGDLNNSESDVHKDHANPRSYYMLEELNNRPRTKYLARVRNAHPILIDSDDSHSKPKTHGHDNDEHADGESDDPNHDESGSTTETPSNGQPEANGEKDH
ncbi:MAG: 4Fe-4S dicluster domain-containing protein [Planctomycetota bacterium]